MSYTSSIRKINRKINRVVKGKPHIVFKNSGTSGAVSWDDVGNKPAPVTNLSGTNTGDQNLSGYALTSHDHTGVYQPIATGTPDGTKYLRDDNTWQAVAGGSGLSQQQVEAIAFLGV